MKHEGTEPCLSPHHRRKLNDVLPFDHVGEEPARGPRGNDRVLKPQFRADVIQFMVLDLRHDMLEPEGASNEAGDALDGP